MKTREYPCHGCGERKQGCHAECGRYRLFSAYVAERKKRSDHESQLEFEVTDTHIKSIQRCKKLGGEK